MKRKIIKNMLFIIVLIVIPSFIAFYSNKVANAIDNLAPLSKYGYKVSIMRYTGNIEPELVGSPILVYEEGLLDEVVKTKKGNYPAGSGEEAYHQLMENNYSLVQMLPKNVPAGYTIESIPTTELAGVDALEGLDALTAEGKNNSDKTITPKQEKTLNDLGTSSSDVIKSPEEEIDKIVSKFAQWKEKALNKFFPDVNNVFTVSLELQLALSNALNSDTQYNFFEYMQETAMGCSSGQKNRFTGECKSSQKTRRYQSDETTTLYSTDLIDLSEYHAIYQDSGTPEEIVIKYAGTPDLISQYFGITLNQMELKNYYIRVEVVQRALEYDLSKLQIVGIKQIKTITAYDPKPSKWTKSGEGWTFEGQNCPDGYSVISNHDSFEKTLTSNCKKCVLDCPDGYDEVNSGDSCYCHKDPETETSYNCRLLCNSGETASGKCGLFNLFTNCKSTTTTTYDNILGTWEYANSYPTYTSCPCTIGVAYNAVIYGTYRVGKSYIVTSRNYNGLEANPAFFLSKASDSCNTSYNQHAILDDNGNPTGKYLYYVGPNLESALVGPSSVDPNDGRINGKDYLFRMSNASWNGSEYKCNGGAIGTGIEHFYFIDIPPEDLCKTECAKEGSNTSDAYLKCAESYCEAKVDYDTNGNARKRKKNCLIDEKICNYKYGHAPGSKNSESVNSCNQSQIVKEFGSDIILDLSSRCNKTNDGRFVPDQKGVMVESCIGDKVTDYDEDDTNDTIFDQRTYINKICKETVSFGFKDTSVLNLTKGSGFTYPVQQEGDKTCKYFINLEQWKFDYASAPARDPEQRTRMQYVLDNFNQQVGSSSADKGMNYRNVFEGEGYGTVDFENEGYDYSKTSISSKENETLITGDKVVTQNGIVAAKKSAMSNLDSKSMDVVNERNTTTKNKTDSRLSTEANDTVTIVANGSIGSRGVNRYISNGTGDVTYTLEKVCISTDGLATVTKAPANEICFQTKEDNKTKDVYAEDKYYTSFKIETDVDQVIGSNVSVGKSGASDTMKYYQIAENCTYRITDKSACQVRVEVLDNGVKLGDKQYEAPRLRATIHYDIDQSDIQKVSMIDNNHETIGEELIILNRNSRSAEVHKVVGKITLKNGNELKCEDTFDLYSSGTCGASCSINKLEETIYEITAVGATNYYSYTSSHMIPSLAVLSQENSIPYEFMKPVYGSVTDGRKYIRLSEGLQENEILFGYVTAGGNGSCNNYCYTNANKGRSDCYSLFKPAETGEIHDYCYANWKTDANGFIDDEDCFKKCTVTACPNNRNNLTVVENYCASYSALGFPDYDHCLNKCYREETDNGTGDYLFRSVNVLDPFPNSQESEGIFEKGDRIVGKNWKFLSGYITDDSEDKTSITGSFANTKVEYVIDMTPEIIRELRRDTRDSDLNSEKNKRGVYAKLDRIQGSSSKVIEEYRSQFIHNSDFTDLFQTGHGDIQASFNPRTN